MSANERIRDSLIDHAIDLRRVDAGTQREVRRIMRDLEDKLRGLVVRHGFLEAKRPSTRDKRMKDFRTASRDMIREAFADISTLTMNDFRQLAALETRKLSQIVNSEIPDE